MREMLLRGAPQHEAQQRASFGFNQTMQRACMSALEQRDLSLIHYARRGAASLGALQRLGALAPAWLLTRPPGRPVRLQLEELADTLDGSREAREYELRARLVRSVTEGAYNKLRPPPESLADPSVDHVIESLAARRGLGRVREGSRRLPRYRSSRLATRRGCAAAAASMPCSCLTRSRRREEPRGDERRGAERSREETRRGARRRDETRRDERSREETRRAARSREEPRGDESLRDEPRASDARPRARAGACLRHGVRVSRHTPRPGSLQLAAVGSRQPGCGRRRCCRGTLSPRRAQSYAVWWHSGRRKKRSRDELRLAERSRADPRGVEMIRR